MGCSVSSSISVSSEVGIATSPLSTSSASSNSKGGFPPAPDESPPPCAEDQTSVLTAESSWSLSISAVAPDNMSLSGQTCCIPNDEGFGGSSGRRFSQIKDSEQISDSSSSLSFSTPTTAPGLTMVDYHALMRSCSSNGSVGGCSSTSNGYSSSCNLSLRQVLRRGSSGSISQIFGSGGTELTTSRVQRFFPQDLEYVGWIDSKRQVLVGRVRSYGWLCALKHVPVDKSQLSEVEQELAFLRLGLERHKDVYRYLVDFYGAFIKEEKVVLVMECMRGSLAQLVEFGIVIPEEVLASIFKCILLGLNYIHHHLRVVHRNLKPSNLLFTQDGIIKIGDFGMSLSFESPATPRESILDMLSLVYISPERMGREGNSSYSSDIWSLGITAFELATQGRDPYGSPKVVDTESSGLVEQMIKFWETNGAPRLRKCDTIYSASMRSCIAQCLQLDPKARLSARQLLFHDWIVDYTPSEESLDEARLQDWLTSSVAPLLNAPELSSAFVNTPWHGLEGSNPGQA